MYILLFQNGSLDKRMTQSNTQDDKLPNCRQNLKQFSWFQGQCVENAGNFQSYFCEIFFLNLHAIGYSEQILAKVFFTSLSASGARGPALNFKPSMGTVR